MPERQDSFQQRGPILLGGTDQTAVPAMRDATYVALQVRIDGALHLTMPAAPICAETSYGLKRVAGARAKVA